MLSFVKNVRFGIFFKFFLFEIIVYLLLFISIMTFSSCNGDTEIPDTNALDDDCECLNDIQVIGSHNSYKIAVEQPILDFIAQLDQALSQSLEYEHISISAQLDLGIRNLEYDVFYDPEGGHYANPQGLDVIRDAGFTPLPYDEDNVLEGPGLKMFHTQDVDFRSHHLLFTDGLLALKEWSDQHSDHTPIIVLINAKDNVIPIIREPVPFDIAGMKLIDDEIADVFDPSQLITPDDVRNNFSTLEEAVLTDGWPSLDEVRGKILFVLDEGETKTNLYLSSFQGLQNAAMFVNVAGGNPEAAFHIVNDPIANQEEIQRLVRLGYMVRTRADSDTFEARANDNRRFEAAITSGAQVISTDYYIPSGLFDSDYQVIFEDGTYERLQGSE
ncbi:phosphatidylinositol-specific phospholipase C1-like protein [Ekhidna sp. To15]|uniref:phosphatidylinositol-specific phospholipase C1-like protein n=1 Tax=Ekhidna sp. To15 TaxID=3395267 RepID=UPI003F528456